MPRPPDAALLDVDGTLVDSNRLHARAWSDAFAEVEVEVSPEHLLKFIGMAADTLVPQVSRLTAEEPLGRQAARRQGELFMERYLPQVRAFPKVRALVLRMKEAGMRVVVASSSSGEKLAALLRAAGVDDLVDARPDRDRVEASKPAPDLVAASLAAAGVAPDRALMLGDTPWDVGAARSAGVPIVAVRCGGWDDAALEGAAALYDDPADLLDHWGESPFALGAAAG